MAVTTTTLGAACAATDIQIKVAAATGFAKGNYIKIDNEVMIQTGEADGLFVPVRRGQLGKAVVAHVSGANVVTGLGTDIPDAQTQIAEPVFSPSQWNMPQFTYDAAGALNPVPGFHQILGAAKAMTLVDPSQLYNGQLMIVCGTASSAHTVSLNAASSSFNDAGSDNDVATFGTGGRQVLLLIAVNGKWCVPSLLAGSNIADVTITLA